MYSFGSLHDCRTNSSHTQIPKWDNGICTQQKMSSAVECHAHLFYLIFVETSKLARIQYFHSRLAPHSRNSYKATVISSVHIYRKKLWITQCPTQLRIDIQLELSKCIVQNLVEFKSIKAK